MRCLEKAHAYLLGVDYTRFHFFLLCDVFLSLSSDHANQALRPHVHSCKCQQEQNRSFLLIVPVPSQVPADDLGSAETVVDISGPLLEGGSFYLDYEEVTPVVQ